ncbi:uncharacterized protein LOC133807316 [Humulus lupulus]|uniref:uncharacterized protein LOC133807316 n=1 Tax=Humulus lupulus TaxID=3486 RepID=UPI002B400D13|nr:uncharacterized protein LOC133807316 [Humulus lupulus]
MQNPDSLSYLTQRQALEIDETLMAVLLIELVGLSVAAAIAEDSYCNVNLMIRERLGKAACQRQFIMHRGKHFGANYELGEEMGRGHFRYTRSAKAKKGSMKGQDVAVKVIPKSKRQQFSEGTFYTNYTKELEEKYCDGLRYSPEKTNGERVRKVERILAPDYYFLLHCCEVRR